MHTDAQKHVGRMIVPHVRGGDWWTHWI